MPPSFLIIDDGWQQTGPDSVGIKKRASRLEAKKDVRRVLSVAFTPTDLKSSKAEAASSSSLKLW